MVAPQGEKLGHLAEPKTQADPLSSVVRVKQHLPPLRDQPLWHWGVQDTSLLPGGRYVESSCLGPWIGTTAFHPHLAMNHSASCQPACQLHSLKACVLMGPRALLACGAQCADSADRVTQGAFLCRAGPGSLCAFLLPHGISKEALTL
ncbi:hypothetical protein HJG60_011894 [Phyllostomus discolor]|uniref:Uncharacterized protein n=1 Tax=Phyllostomus discolor TaxID=89673 RepID=A0A833ZLR0_9CHIR|nr:hypothetical protein HJG60_011894 [Phyllostomus discolor]